MWPILGRLLQPKSVVFLIGAFSGYAKPVDQREYLSDLIYDLKRVLSDGVREIQVTLHSIICDAPARAYIRQTKSHSGLYACDKCVIAGNYIKPLKKTIFSTFNSPLRTDADFRLRKQPLHHKGVSAFEDLDIDMIKCFPLDYMHMVCLGVTGKYIKYIQKINIQLSFLIVLLWSICVCVFYDRKLKQKQIYYISDDV